MAYTVPQNAFNNYWGGTTPNTLQTANRQQFTGLGVPKQQAFMQDASNFADYDFSNLGNSTGNSGGGPKYNWDVNQKFELGMNMGTLQLGGAILGAYNGWQANKAAKQQNVIAREQLEQNAKSFDINTGLQLSTMQAEESRRNAYAGGFLDESQRSDRFRDYDLQKLSVS
jgi:hypothetical protein